MMRSIRKDELLAKGACESSDSLSGRGPARLDWIRCNTLPNENGHGSAQSGQGRGAAIIGNLSVEGHVSKKLDTLRSGPVSAAVAVAPRESM